jgi:ornithine decarboxylase
MATPQFILSKKRLAEQFETIGKLGVTISYSLKTNPLVGQILHESTNCVFSVHHENELEFIKDKSRVLFLGHAFTNERLESLMSQGITSFVVDNHVDLDLLLEFIKSKKLKIDLLLRMKMKEHSVFTGKYFVFGMPSSQINKRIPELKQNPLIQQLGIHFHRKTQNTSEWQLRHELEESLTDKTFECIDVINIGGGLPSLYKNTSDKVIAGVLRKITELNEWLKRKSVDVMIEPGRYLAAPCIKLKTTVLSKIDNTLVVDASVYNASMDTIIVPVKLLVEGELTGNDAKEALQNNTATRVVVKGVTPCSLDIFRYECILPTPKVGQTVTFLNAGAYNFTTTFCELSLIPTVITDSFD